MNNTIKQKTIRFKSTELDINRYFASPWDMNHSVVVRRILREFKDIKNVEIGRREKIMGKYNQISLFPLPLIPKDSDGNNTTEKLPVCSCHLELLPHIKTLDVTPPHIVEAKCGDCNKHIQWLTRENTLKLIEFCPTDDEINNIRLRLTATDSLPKTNDEWKKLTFRLWQECQQKGHKVGWIWYQLKHKNAPPGAFKELERLISADFI